MIRATATWAANGPATPLRSYRFPTLDGGRLVIRLTAAGIAMLPFLAGGVGNAAPVDVFFALAVAGCLLWAGRTGRRLRFPYAVPVGLIVAAGALGALAGPVPRAGAVTLIQDLWLVAWCWTVVNVAWSKDRLGVLFAAWVYSSIAWAGALVVGLIGHWTLLTGQTAEEGSRTTLTFLDPNYAGSYFFISVMLMWASGYPRNRGARVAAYALLIVALLSTGSMSAMISLLVGVAVASVLGVHRRSGLVPAVALLAAAVLGGSLVASVASLPELQRTAKASPHAFLRDGIGRGASSASGRETLLAEGFQLYREGGPLGTGPVSTKQRLRDDMAPVVKEAHNDYMAALVERGPLGVLGLALLLGAVALRVVPLVQARAGSRALVAGIKPHALAGALAGTMVAFAFNELLHVRHVWTLFAFIAALYLVSRR
jgi:O-Antigen ligase